MKKLLRWLLRKRKSKNNGFTLLEILLVVGFLAGIIFFSIPHLTFLRRKTVEMELQTLYATLMYMHQCAQATGIDQTIVCDLKRQVYSYQNTTHALCAGVKFGIPHGTQGPPSCPTQRVTSPITCAHDRIVCTCQGAMTPGTLYLTDTDEQYVYALTISVGDIPYVRKYIYDGAWRIIT